MMRVWLSMLKYAYPGCFPSMLTKDMLPLPSCSSVLPWPMLTRLAFPVTAGPDSDVALSPTRSEEAGADGDDGAGAHPPPQQELSGLTAELGEDWRGEDEFDSHTPPLDEDEEEEAEEEDEDEEEEEELTAEERAILAELYALGIDEIYLGSTDEDEEEEEQGEDQDQPSDMHMHAQRFE